MKVKELKERLQAFDQELDVYLYNDKEPALYLADTINQTSDWGDEDGWEDFITIFPSTEIKHLFTLTAEEIMEIKCAISNRIHDLEIMSKYSSTPNVFLLEGIKICENLLKRLNDYGKEV